MLWRFPLASMLLVAAGCAVGANRAADLPNPRPFPLAHPPDAHVVLRETRAHWENRLEVAAAGLAPLGYWALSTFLIPF